MYTTNLQLCCYCGLFLKDLLYHLTFACSKCSQERDDYWDEITDQLSVVFSAYLYNLPDEEMYTLMLGGTPSIELDDTELDCLLKLSANHLTSIIKYKY